MYIRLSLVVNNKYFVIKGDKFETNFCLSNIYTVWPPESKFQPVLTDEVSEKRPVFLLIACF